MPTLLFQPFTLGAILIGLWFVVAILVWARLHNRNRMLQTLLGAVEKPLLFYDRRGKLAYRSPGILLFDSNSLGKISHTPVWPQVGQSVMGEVVIDHNRYRYVAKLLEYRPGESGVLCVLEYLGSEKPKQP